MAEPIIQPTKVVRMMITSQKSGVATYLDGETILGEKTFRHSDFSKFEEGSIVECHFQVSESRRTMVYARLISLADEKPEPHQFRDFAESIPEWIGSHFFDRRLRTAFGALSELMRKNEIVNVLARGASGYGKTSSFQSLAEHLGMDYLRVDCATTLDPEQWFGYQEARGGSTVFIPTPFTEAITKGNVIVVLDEANRIEPWIANPLFPILDHARRSSVHGLDVAVAPKTIFAMTVNEGAQYAGTYQMDKALVNRIDIFIRMEPIPQAQEIDLLIRRHAIPMSLAEQIVNAAKQLRETVKRDMLEIDVSTRTTLKVARLVSIGMRPRHAYEMVVLESTQTHESKAITDSLNITLPEK